jgi:hypothetical protein
MKSAVAFFVYNRPGVTARVWERIREARPPKLFIVADGPRPNRPDDAVKCEQVRAVVSDCAVDWPCSVLRIYSSTNLGCGLRVSSGLDAVFNEVEEAIILEDDCLPDPSFFPFCDELLERYRDDKRVAQIAGCSFLPSSEARMNGYFFSLYPHCWGWATWRRAWVHYDHAMRAWSLNREASWKVGPVSIKERLFWARCFDSVLENKVDTWDYRWTSTLWNLGMLSINSRVNLISNIGFDADATHTRGGAWGNLPVHPAILPPPKRECVTHDKSLDEIVGKLVFEPPSLQSRVLRFIRRMLTQ